MPDSNKSENLSYVVAITAVLLGLYLSSFYNYLLFHSLIEITTIAIAFTLFILTWNTRRYWTNNYIRLLGIGYAFIALIDLLHTLGYKGMGVFAGYGANLPTQLWIAARYLQALTLLAAPLVVSRRVNTRAIIGIYAIAVSVLVSMVYSGNFPDCFIEGKGLTTFKIGSEYLITALLLASLYLFYGKRKMFNPRVFWLIAASITCTAFSEIAFTTYVSVYGFANMVGHFAKLAAFYLIYRAILVTGLREPFELIFKDFKQTEEALLKSQDTLEEKVRERTVELRTSEARYRSLVRKVQTAIVLHDGQGRILDSNPLAHHLLGLSADQLLGMSLIDPEWHFLREDGSVLPVAEYPVSRVLSTRQPLRGYVTGIHRPDQDDIAWVLVNAEPEYDGAGQIALVVVSFVDISERKRAEQELRQMNERFTLATTAARLGVWDWDIQKNELVWDDGMYALYGVKKGEFAGAYEAWLNGVHPDDRALSNEISKLARRGDREYDTEFRVVWPDGSIHYLKAYGQVVRDVDGRPLRMTGVNYDVTANKQAEESLYRLNRELQAISSCNKVLVRAEDEKGLLNDICRIICEEDGYRMAWVGYAENDEAKSVHPAAWAGSEDGYLASADLTWADTQRGRGPTGTAIRSGESTCIQDFKTVPHAAPWRENALQCGYRSSIALPLKDESAKTFGVLNIYSNEPNAFRPDEIRLLEDLAGDLAFGIVILRARSERKQMEQELSAYREHLEELVRERTSELEKSQEQIINLNQDLQSRAIALEVANKELDAFAYTASHDLRAPLRHLSGFIELLQKKGDTNLDEQSRHYMHAISDSAQKMGQLIDDLLSFSRMGRYALSIQQVDLGSLIHEITEELEADVAGRKIVWSISDLPTVSGDASMLRVALVNLISNALKFTRMQLQTHIEIGSLSDQDSETVIYVRDNGVGFDMTYANKLFGVFQRLHRADEFEGTGIGLATVRRIIARHGGRTWAQAELDQGATFYFALPHTLQRGGDEKP